MARDTVVFKGTRGGISIQIDEKVDFKQALSDLRNKLQPARCFFLGASVKVDTGKRPLDSHEQEALANVVAEYGLTLSEEEDLPDLEENKLPIDDQTLLVRRTLRSGQRINYPGNIVVLGDVNPGAELVATGDIIILGTLRGVAHAGATGNAQATIIGLHLEPTQVRIAGHISRSPDDKASRKARGPEKAYVQDQNIVINHYEPGLFDRNK